jgi:hypothetical protein
MGENKKGSDIPGAKFFPKKRRRVIPYYLKKGLPDERFLEFRLFIHNRKANDVQHDIKYFEPMIRYKKKQNKSFSEYREDSAFKQKKKKYMEYFTNGSVDIEVQKRNESVDFIRSQFEQLGSWKSAKLNRMLDKAIHQKKRKLEQNLRPKSEKLPITPGLSRLARKDNSYVSSQLADI